MKDDRIIDSSASNHMYGRIEIIKNVRESINNHQINPPTCQTSNITHIGDGKLKNDLTLKEVLCVPAFKHNIIYL